MKTKFSIIINIMSGIDTIKVWTVSRRAPAVDIRKGRTALNTFMIIINSLTVPTRFCYLSTRSRYINSNKNEAIIVITKIKSIIFMQLRK